MKKPKRKVDRISQLPDAVLGHILSYVPTKQSVQTSILSKRWLLVWTNVTSICIDDSTLFAKPIAGTDQTVDTSLSSFVSNVFNPCNEAFIRKFTLKCRDKFDLVHINRWILAAKQHRIRELDICIKRRGVSKISHSLFAYQELVELKLGKRFTLKVPGTFCFPSLKKLHLRYIEFHDDDINKLLSSSTCPVLEDLHIEECRAVKLDTLDINASALKFLTIDAIFDGREDSDSESYDYYFYEVSTYKFILEAPNLEVLNYSSHFRMKDYCFKNLVSLVKVDIDVNLDYVYDHENSEYTSCAPGMLKGIANSKNLRLTARIFEFDPYTSPEDLDFLDFPIFHNLKELHLGGSDCCGLLLFHLIYNSPNLEVLVINQVQVNNFEWENTYSVPECMHLRLKVVKIWGFKKLKDVDEFISYVLQNARVLNEFLVARSESMVEEVKIRKNLLTYLTSGKIMGANDMNESSELKELKVSVQLLTYLRRHCSALKILEET